MKNTIIEMVKVSRPGVSIVVITGPPASVINGAHA